MNFDAAIPLFLTEATELLEKMEMSLVELARSGASPELINDIFRAAHTIKGTSGVFGFDTVVEFTHVVESLLDRIRAGQQTISPELASLLLQSGDHMRVLVNLAAESGELSSIEQQTHDHLLAALQQWLEPDAAGATLPTTTTPVTSSAQVTRAPQGNDPQIENHHWHISVRFDRAVLQYGMDPLSFLRYLQRLGQVVDVVTLFDEHQSLAELNPEHCYLGLEIMFQGEVSKQELEDVFEFVRDDCTLHILPPVARVSQYMELIKALPEEDLKLGEILVRAGALTPAELEQALHRQDCQREDAAPTGPLLGEVLVEAGHIQSEVVQAAAAKQASVRKALAESQKTLRVDADKLDQLVNFIGELVIAAASSKLVAARSGDSDMIESTSIMGRLVESIRDCALSLRMVQIGETFNRFQRVVLDVSRELGKDVRLDISGADAELDKTLVERVRDPLMHLVRNGIDHGLENAEVRRAAGKPAQGCIRLNAFHDSGSIIIEVEDDGRGLQRDRIRQKALERGLIREQDELSDREIYKLIFEPGFSTADQVTNLSGRGVGMDVVRREVEALRGSIDIDSQPGQGTKISIRLPLTLAIINGFLFRVGSAHYVVPLELVGECIESPRLSSQDADYMNLRGSVLPLLRLSHLFQLETRANQRENVIVVGSAGSRTGLVVNELMGEFQTVIKPMGQMFAQLKGIAGSTILGSGEVAIVLAPHELIQAHVQHHRPQAPVSQAHNERGPLGKGLERPS